MSFERGRAWWGARSVWRFLALGVLTTVGLFACGSTVFVYGIPLITVSVTPGNPAIKAFIVEFDGITINRTDGTPTNLFGTNSFTNLERVDLMKSLDLNEIWGAPAVLEGTYTTGSITIDWTSAQVVVDVGGKLVNATILDPAGAVASTQTFNIKFDPNNPLVFQQSVVTPININFDISASSIVNTSASTPTVTVRPYVSVSNNPTYSKTIRARGVTVTADTAAGTFTMNSRPFYDEASNPFGALTIQTSSTTTYNVNGTNFSGSAGLAAINALPINTSLAVFGTIASTTNGTGTQTTPIVNAQQVVAGLSFENLAADRIIGTVSSISNDVINVHGAEIITRPGEIVSDAATTQIIQYFPDLPVTVDSGTLVVLDGQPNANATIQSISIGQQIDLNGQAATNSSGVIASENATGAVGGIIRLNATPAWGTLNAAPANGQLSLNVVTLDNYEPSALTFTGTGSTGSGGADSNPAAYLVATNGLAPAGLTAGEQLRVDGFVLPYGSAGSSGDFTATAITPAASEQQTLTVDYVNGGATNAFVSADSNGLVLNMSTANLGPTHVILTGPFSTDLLNPLVNVTIVPAASAQFVVGDPADNTTTGLAVFNTFAGLLGQLPSAGALEKIVATGTFDGNHTFTANRIDLVTWQ